jgi:transposase
MKINPSNRKTWFAKDKLIVVEFLDLTEKMGKSIPISEIAGVLGVTAKTLYQWKKLYQLKGADAFNDLPRKSNASKYNNPELQANIYDLVLPNPRLSAKDIIQKLDHQHSRISVPTVQKVLKLKGLNTLKLRLIATEYEHVNKNLKITKSTLDDLVKKNPYFDLLQINRQIKGCLFYLKFLDLSSFYQNSTGYLLLAVDTKSLTTFSLVWDGKYLDETISFINDLSTIFGAKSGEVNYFDYDENHIFKSLRNSESGQKIKWFDSAKYYFSPDRFEIALSELLKEIQMKFLKPYKFTSVEKLQKDLKQFLYVLRITCGPLGYPTFGKSPDHLTKK